MLPQLSGNQPTSLLLLSITVPTRVQVDQAGGTVPTSAQCDTLKSTMFDIVDHELGRVPFSNWLP